MNRKSIAGVTAGAIALGGLASLSLSTTAHALPPSVTVTSTAAGMAPSASAVATCPAGSALVGTGGKITGGAGQVVMTDVIPDVAAGTVTVWGVEKVAYGGAWSVSAYAVCDAQITNVVRVGMTTNMGVPTKTVTPTCPGNKVLTGVGYQLLGANGQVFPNQVIPNAGLNGAQVQATASSGFGGAWSLTGYAICGTPPAGVAPPLRVVLAGPVNMAGPKSVTTPPCQNGRDLVGLGGELVGGGAGKVILDQITPNAPLTSATARGSAFVPAIWGVTAYGVCW